MRLLLTSFVVLFSFLNSFGQKLEDYKVPNEPFLFLKDSTLLSANQFTFERRKISSKFYDNKGHKISQKDVWFYNDDLHTYGYSRYGLLRLNYRGYYNIYTDIFIDSTGEPDYYFNRGFGEFVFLAPNVLQEKLRVFPDGFDPNVKVEVLEILDQMKKRDRNFWWVAGGTVAAFSLAGLFIDQSRDTPDRAERPGLRTVGLGFGAVGLGGFITFLVMPKSRKLSMKALQTYNSGF